VGVGSLRRNLEERVEMKEGVNQRRGFEDDIWDVELV
jgi:hypothetical protein